MLPMRIAYMKIFPFRSSCKIKFEFRIRQLIRFDENHPSTTAAGCAFMEQL